MKLLLRKIPSYFLIITAFVCAFASYAFTSMHYRKMVEEEKEMVENTILSTTNACNLKVSRLGGRKYIKPLLYAEKTCEAERFVNLKNAVNSVIVNLREKQEISNASVYVRLFYNGEWVKINDEVKYQPGSLFKVPLLITYLRMEEQHPGFIDKKLTFANVTEQSKQFSQSFMKSQIQLGKSYTIRELFKYMIIHSDNNATMLLFNNISPLEFEKTFTDLNLDKNMTKSDGVISASDYSRFWLTLYNGSYLNFDNSEYALKLLSQSDFNEGIMKGLPHNIMVAHKFGEKGNGKEFCLHETGIIYSNDKPYLVTIMTVGNNQKALPGSLQQISTTVHSNIEQFTK